MLFQKGNPLRARVNEAITAIREDGRLEAMQKKWFPGTESLTTFE